MFKHTKKSCSRVMPSITATISQSEMYMECSTPISFPDKNNNTVERRQSPRRQSPSEARSKARGCRQPLNDKGENRHKSPNEVRSEERAKDNVGDSSALAPTAGGTKVSSSSIGRVAALPISGGDMHVFDFTSPLASHDGKIVIGIDVGEINMALSVLRVDTVTCTYSVINNFHYDLTRGYSIRSLGRRIHQIVYDMLDEVMLGKYHPDNTLVKIEDQLCQNRNCLVIQHIIETILYMRGYECVIVNARKKYTQLKLLIGRKPTKRDLIKYVKLDPGKFVFRQYNIEKAIFEEKPTSVPKKTILSSKEQAKPLKYDDIADSCLVAIENLSCANN